MSRSSVRIELAVLNLFFTLLPIGVFSQSKADTAFIAASIANAKKVYEGFIQGNAHLYNGTEHKAYQSLNEEHPYFIMDDWAIGSIVYDNELNENIATMYDLWHDKVVIEHFSSKSKIELISKKVSEFKLHDHTFVALKPDSAKQIQEGFYDQLYKGKISVYARRTKQYEERIQSNVLVRSFAEKNKYFLLKDGKYLPVNSKAAALDALHDKRKILKQQLSKSRIKYKKEKEKWLVTLAGYYDTLKD
ncbi:MAG TPA: hypothetical protein VGQ59_10645 [Cyclobacteriaceae bacterium]|jgi:hypothetical protein|nr:hypothetical protein [Cyclobacteriaceae bacterium]